MPITKQWSVVSKALLDARDDERQRAGSADSFGVGHEFCVIFLTLGALTLWTCAMRTDDFFRRRIIPLGYRQLSAGELMARACGGDPEAFVALVCLKYSAVEAVCRAAVGPAGPAEDLALETFVQLWRHRNDLRNVRRSRRLARNDGPKPCPKTLSGRSPRADESPRMVSSNRGGDRPALARSGRDREGTGGARTAGNRRANRCRSAGIVGGRVRGERCACC